jgi:hypothetical protein
MLSNTTFAEPPRKARRITPSPEKVIDAVECRPRQYASAMPTYFAHLPREEWKQPQQTDGQDSRVKNIPFQASQRKKLPSH